MIMAEDGVFPKDMACLMKSLRKMLQAKKREREK